MNRLIKTMIEKNSDTDLQKRFEEVIKISEEMHSLAVENKIPMGPGVVGGSPCIRDLLFWYLTARTFKPKNVVEVGSWIGTSTLVIAKALYEIYGDDFTITTCDYPTNVYITNHNYKHLSDNIYYNNIHSDNLFQALVDSNGTFDAVFSDADLTGQNIRDFGKILDPSNLLFVTHDVYPHANKNEKGNRAINEVDKAYGGTQITPTKESGYIVEGYDSYPINAVTGIILSGKYESII